MSPTHSRWCSLPDRVAPPRKRWPSGWASVRPSTMAAAPEPRVSEANCGEDLLGVAVAVLQPADGRVVDAPGVLTVDHQRVVDLPALQHRGGELHAVDEAEAGVRDVEVLARAGQAERVVHGDGGRRLQVGPTDRGVDQQADVAGVGHRRPPSPSRRPSPRRRRRWCPSFHQRRSWMPASRCIMPGRRPDPAVDRRQPLVHLGGGDDHRCVDRADRQHRGVARIDGLNCRASGALPCRLANSDPLTARSPGRVRRPSPMSTGGVPDAHGNRTAGRSDDRSARPITTARAGSPSGSSRRGRRRPRPGRSGRTPGRHRRRGRAGRESPPPPAAPWCNAAARR